LNAYSPRVAARGSARAERAFTLVELMVSLAVATTLVAAALTTLSRGRNTYRLAEAVQELQETGRFALGALETDVVNAGYLGLASTADRIQGTAKSEAGSRPAVDNDCGLDWAISLDTPLGGQNDDYGLDCPPYAGRATSGADVLVIRRASLDVASSKESGRLYLLTNRAGGGRLLVGDTPSTPFDGEDIDTRELVARAFYVSDTSSLSTAGNRVPSLRMKTLIGGNRGPRIADEEVMPGIEDLQVELGIDTNASGAVDRYVQPDDAILSHDAAPGGRPPSILAVRVWLRTRAERRDTTLRGETRLEYAGRSYTAPQDQYRRDLVSTTFHVPNARAKR